MTNQEGQELKTYLEQRFDGIDKRFDGVDKRLDSVDKRLDGVDKRLDRIDTHLDRQDVDFNNTTMNLLRTIDDAGAQLLTFDSHFQQVHDLDCTLLDDVSA
jgi:uncharacterized protein YicC (UPF0701 family)